MKHRSDNNGTVYSTNPDFVFDYGEEEAVTIEPATPARPSEMRLLNVDPPGTAMRGWSSLNKMS